MVVCCAVSPSRKGRMDDREGEQAAAPAAKVETGAASGEWIAKMEDTKYNQAHLVAEGVDAAKLATQLASLDQGIPGGLLGYIERSKKLLHDVKNDVNPLEDYTVSFAEGVDLCGAAGPGSVGFEEYEKIGMEKLGKLGFVLVAGGLGERLGYPGIKVEIPTEMTTKLCFLELYVKYVLAAQEYANKGKADGEKVTLPLCIMTSGDTHAKTMALLEKNKNFGLDEKQLFIMQQDKVPAFSGENCEFVLNEAKDGIETKPHGHGDVHTLMHMKGIAKKWLTEMKLEYLMFFQDTNPLAFRAMASCLGVSVKHDFAMNSLAVPRKAGEAAGAIVQLVRKADAPAGDLPEKLVINVEYNLLGGLLASQGGDCAVNDANDSAYPGNTNILMFNLEKYVASLDRSQGVMPEFVNPKFQDAEKTKFKPTRLECLMQDFPRLFEDGVKVGFTKFDRWLCFTCVKNNLEDAKKKSAALQPADCCFSCESDMYYCANRLLLLSGKDPAEGEANSVESVEAELAAISEQTEFLGISKQLAPQVVLLPSFALSLAQLRGKVTGKGVKVAKGSTMVLEGSGLVLNGFSLDGAVSLAGESSLAADLEVKNAGAKLQALEKEADTDFLKIRGYDMAVSEMWDLPTLLEKTA
ncbi:unnamed protein product [Amoebophrya sp. A25]|nr:unnamed protein product [Amoebophrya sp. A25]|eukprot:GSA25T00026601001.1